MEYKKLSKCDTLVSKLGLGSMRLPCYNNDLGVINEKEVVRMVHYAIDHGVNYIDTAYTYHKGNSEIVLGKALRDGYRKRVILATKSPAWLIEKHDDFDLIINKQLEKLGTDHIDVYLFHALNKKSWQNVIEHDGLDFLNQALKSGKIKHAGFSFHDDLNVFKDIVDAYPWSMCQIMLNYLDDKFQAGVEGLKYAASKGLAVAVMEPLKGGLLADNLPATIKQLFNGSSTPQSPVAWALEWVWSHPGVSVALSGMSSMEQVKENIKIANQTKQMELSKEKLELLKKVKREFKAIIQIDCTNCRYCLPCPTGIDIPKNFALYNRAYIYHDIQAISNIYRQKLPTANRASACIECRKCESLCPQRIPIVEKLKLVDRTLRQE